MDHRRFTDLAEELVSGDVLVVNETRVLPARLRARKRDTGGAVEVLLLRERYESTWECLVKPGRRVPAGVHLEFAGGEMTGFVVEVLPESGGRLIRFDTQKASFIEVVHRIGEMPLPPYITEPLEDSEQYQTVFARDERSAAAPTAGLHFTPELLDRIESRGVSIVRVELDVGLDTFRPVSEADPRDHEIHSEHVRVGPDAAERVQAAKEEGGRVVAVGTTSVRALESAYDVDTGRIGPMEGQTDLYILPGHKFRVVDAVVTNFHVPRSTLVMMMSAFAGRELLSEAYGLAIDERYRFLSFGDAMLVV
jgi:S-adenosylmethionine:tRNA ribosyltransferase-isomerase